MALAVDPEPVPLMKGDDQVWRVAGTRVTLDTLVAAFERGDSPEEIHEQYTSVALGDIYAVLTYYVRHRHVVDAHLADRADAATAVRARIEAAMPPDGLRARLLARTEQ